MIVIKPNLHEKKMEIPEIENYLKFPVRYSLPCTTNISNVISEHLPDFHN